MFKGKVPLDFGNLYPYLYPLLGGITRGKLGDWWIYKYYKASFGPPNVDYSPNPNRLRFIGNQGIVICKIYYSEQPRTPFQQGNRSILYSANYNWHQFDVFTKDFYNQLIRPEHMSGYNRYLSLYLRANYPMIIYWENQKQSATQDVTIPEYIASPYFRANAKLGAIILDIDGGGLAITTGIKADVRIPFSGVIKSWRLLADQAGAIVVDVWNDTFANFPPTVTDTITGTEKPTLVDVDKNEDTNLTTWIVAVAEGDILRFNVDSVATVTRVHLELQLEKD